MFIFFLPQEMVSHWLKIHINSVEDAVKAIKQEQIFGYVVG